MMANCRHRIEVVFLLLCVAMSLAGGCLFVRDLLFFYRGQRPIVPFFEWVFALVSPPNDYFDSLAEMPVSDVEETSSFSHFYRGQYGVCLVIPSQEPKIDWESLNVRIVLTFRNEAGTIIAENETAVRSGLLGFQSDSLGTELVLFRYSIPEIVALDRKVFLSCIAKGKIDSLLREFPKMRIRVAKLSDE